jgi:hypothetical protein
MIPVPGPAPAYDLTKLLEVYKDAGLRHTKTETVKIADVEIPIAVLERDCGSETIQFAVMCIYRPMGFEENLIESICLALRLDPSLAAAKI